MASKKTAKKAAKALSPKLAALVASAASIGYGVAEGFSAGVTLARNIGQGHKMALIDAGLGYKSGYIVRYFEDAGPAYAKRTGNMSQAQRFEDALAIYAKAGPETAKPNRRTALEHKACRAADVSWTGCKNRAFGTTPKARKPRPATAKVNPVPVDLVKASPNLPTKVAVNDYFATAMAALLATVDKNAKRVMPQISSAISDCNAAIKLALNL